MMMIAAQTPWWYIARVCTRWGGGGGLAGTMGAGHANGTRAREAVVRGGLRPRHRRASRGSLPRCRGRWLRAVGVCCLSAQSSRSQLVETGPRRLL